MTTHQDTIKAYQEYVTTAKELDAAHEASLAEYQSLDNKYRKRTVASFKSATTLFFGGTLVSVAGMCMEIAGSPDSLGMVVASYGVGSTILSAVPGLLNTQWAKKIGSEKNSDNHRTKTKRELFNKFFTTVADEMRDKGLNILDINTEGRFITTDQGIVTVVTSKESDIPKILLNGATVQSSYLSETQEVVNMDGQTIRVPAALVSI